jgi:hypothetical protein
MTRSVGDLLRFFAPKPVRDFWQPQELAEEAARRAAATRPRMAGDASLVVSAQQSSSTDRGAVLGLPGRNPNTTD